MKSIFKILILELLYIFCRNPINYFIQDDVVKELAITGLRLLSFIVFWFLFRKKLKHDRLEKIKIFNSKTLIPSILFLLIPLVFSNFTVSSESVKWVMIFTSITVGMREELVYRGIIQKMLNEKMNIWGTFLIVNILFMFMHVGFVHFSINRTIDIFLAGMFLSLIYYVTQSLILVIALHALYDINWLIAPNIGNNFSLHFVSLSLAFTVIVTILIYKRNIFQRIYNKAM